MEPHRKQLPLFLSPELERAVAELPKDLRVIALELHRHALGDGRSWLDATWAATQAERATLEQVLGGDRHNGPAGARRAAWYEIRERTGASYPEIAKTFEVNHTTVRTACIIQAHRIAASKAAVEAVEQYNAGGSAA